MKKFLLITVIIGLGAGAFWFWEDVGSFRDTLMQYVENGELMTLEAHYSPQQIMEKHRSELLPDSQYTYQEPSLKFYPYLLIEAKYTQGDKKTKEGQILWSLVDGEMVLDSELWEKTHGFSDAIEANAARTDFKVMHALAKNQGSCTREQLQKELHLEADTLEPWINSAIQKYLVVQNGSELHLHLQNPKILVVPQTKIKQAFVTRPYRHAQCMTKRYSRSQIERIAQAAFGPSFTIRNVKEVYLPVYGISVLNPDGSLLTSHWNALNGQRIESSPK